ncbi:MAG: tetratricopeptide repeat protein [Chloroflexota bacterium]|nr:MAG: tetratricopeptide repeat protein [Chloroflexota bacterium]
MNELERLSRAIEHLESQRENLGNEVVDTALAPLQERVTEIERQFNFPDMQRKQVTILFADIVDSTRISQHLDPEDTRDIFDSALQRLAQPVSLHRGHVTRFMGDGFKAVFGTPQAHEDDPRQAVYAGLAIHEICRDLAEEMREEWNIPNLQVRVGINTGLVAVGGSTEAGDTHMGSTVNLTKRIESACPPGELLISHDTYRHVRGIFDINPLEPITAKGFDQPVAVYQVISAKKRSLGIDTVWVEGIETRMVGRDSELDILKQARQKLFSKGRGEILTIHGEAGIGKSRLLFEFRNWEETQQEYIRLFLGRGRQDIQNQPYAMWRELFAFRFEIFDSDPNEIVIQKLESGFGEIFSQEDSGRMRAHFIGQLLGFDCSQCASLKGVLSDPGQLREQASRYLLEYYTGLSKIVPVIILIEDLHWVDDRSLDLLDQVGAITPDHPLLIINVCRNIFFERFPQWGQEQDYHKLLRLAPLTEIESEQLVTDILQKVPEIPTALRQHLVEQAEGNPFYIEELIKMLIESGVILTGKENWQLALVDLIDLQIPPTLTGVLQARLDALPADERRILQIAAVFGKDFWDLALQQVSESPFADKHLDSPLDAQEKLSSIIRRELIFKRGESVFAGTRQFSFKHIMFRDVIYQTIPRRERALYHGLTADWFVAVTQANQRAEEYAAVIADHYLAAGSELYAADWFYRAGRRAKAQVAMKEARTYLEKSLHLIPADDLERRWQVLLLLDEIILILGDKEARLIMDQELINLAQRIKDENLLAQAYHRQAYYFGTQGDYQAELAAHEKALAAARSARNRLVETSTLGLQVACLTFLGEMPAAQQSAELAVAYARQLGDQDTLAKVLGNASTYYQVVDISKAVSLIEESIQIMDGLGETNLKAFAMINLGYIYTQSGLFQRGVEIFHSSLDIARTIENPRIAAYSQLNMGLAYYRLGELQLAQECLNTARSICQETQDAFSLAACQMYLGLTLQDKGQFDKANDSFTEALKGFQQTGASGYAMDALAGLARCAMEAGDLEQASQLCSQVLEYLGQHGSQGMEFPTLAYLTCARVCDELGDGERRRKIIKEGYQQLMERAEKISDLQWKMAFVGGIPENFFLVNSLNF